MKLKVNMYDKKKQLFSNFPIIYSDNGIPKREGYYTIELNEWNMKKNDYIKVNQLSYFDGTNFHPTENLFDYDSTSWISKWVAYPLDINSNNQDWIDKGLHSKQ